MELIDIVQKLAGPIDPIGETRADEMRLDSLKDVTDLIEILLVKIAHVAENRNRQEFSMKRAGKHAFDFLSRSAKWLEENGTASNKEETR